MRRCVAAVAAILCAFAVLFTPPSATGAPVAPLPALAPATLSAGAAPFVSRVLPSRPGDTFVALTNGLTVLVREAPGSGVVSSNVYVRAGSTLEGKYFLSGLSHYLEHIVAGGTTKTISEEEGKRRLERMGGSSNAYTSWDRTVYFINTGAANWKDSLDLLLSWVTECSLEPSEVEREKGVIQQEFKLGENDPSRELSRLFFKTAYRVHPMREPVIGYENVFVARTRDDLRDYYGARYRPQNMIIAVGGDVLAAEVIAAIGARTKDFARQAEKPLVLPPEPLQVGPRWAEKEMPIARLTQVMVGYPSVSQEHPDMVALDVLASVLGDGVTSRLYRRLRDKDKLAFSVSASDFTPAAVAGRFIVSLDLAPENWPKALGPLEEEIARVKAGLVSEAELAAVKKKVIAENVFGKETVSAQVSSLAGMYYDTGDPYFDDRYVEAVQRVTREDLRRVARAYLDPARRVVAVVKPPAKAEAPAAGPAAAAKDVGPGPVKLPNGLTVLVKRDTSLPVVSIQLYGVGGLLLEGEGVKPGISAFTAGLLTAGTKTRGKLAIAHAIEDQGGAIASGSESNTWYVAAKVLKSDLDTALDIVSDVLQNASFPPVEIERARRETLLAIKSQDESWAGEVIRLFKRAYFAKHPYGHDRLGTAESVASFTRADVLSWQRRMVIPNTATLAVYGDVDPAAVIARLRERLKAWKPGPNPLPALPDETAPLTADRTVEKKNEKTSAALLIGTNGLAVTDPDRPSADLMDVVLSGGGVPGGRLFSALRGGTNDLVYTVQAFPFYGVRGGFFGVLTQTSTVNLQTVRALILENLKRLEVEPLSAEDLASAKSALLAQHFLARESIGSRARSDALNTTLGLGWDYDARYPGLIAKVSAADIQRVAQKLFTHTLIATTIPENPVEPLIKNIPTHKMHDIK